jgi:hypothetical protein
MTLIVLQRLLLQLPGHCTSAACPLRLGLKQALHRSDVGVTASHHLLLLLLLLGAELRMAVAGRLTVPLLLRKLPMLLVALALLLVPLLRPLLRPLPCLLLLLLLLRQPLPRPQPWSLLQPVSVLPRTLLSPLRLLLLPPLLGPLPLLLLPLSSWPASLPWLPALLPSLPP